MDPSEPETPPSRLGMIVLVVTPALVFYALCEMTLWFVGYLAFMSAVGHGHLTTAEAAPWLALGGLVALLVGAGVMV